jgi:hypothetical protein
MHLTPTLVLAATLFHASSATISLGHGGGRGNLAWIDGDDVCGTPGKNKDTVRDISASGQSPCGHRFTLVNGRTYEVQGCGGDLWLNEIVNGQAQFNSNCHYISPNQHIGCYLTTPDVIKDYNCY